MDMKERTPEAHFGQNEMRPYPRGFVYCRSFQKVPDGYVQGPISGLYVAPDARVQFAGCGDISVTVVGICVTTRDNLVDSACFLLDALKKGDGEFFDAEGELCGRYVIFAKKGERIWILNDAAAMRSVFYRDDLSAVASHASIIASSGEVCDLPFKYGFPGNGTPYADVWLLTANTLIELPAGKVIRYWPRGAIRDVEVGVAARFVMDAAVASLRHVARNRTVRLSLTAGMDSRTMLAVCKSSGIEFEAYTYGNGKDTEIDRLFASHLASMLGLVHTVVPTTPAKGRLEQLLSRATYASHHWSAVGPLQEYFRDPDAIAVSANLLEIGRCFYLSKNDSLPQPVTARGMRELYSTRVKRAVRESYGLEKFNSRAEKYFEKFLLVSQFNSARGIVDPYDQFYWEHRMSAWHGLNMLERDFYAQAFIPFNSRSVWEKLLGVPMEQRKKADVFHEMIRMADIPSLPFNPDRWPM